MEEEIKDDSEVHETTEKVEETTEKIEEPEEALTPEQIADLKKRADASSQNYERAKKAEARAKELEGKANEAPSHDGLSSKDILFLAKADIHEDNLDEVLSWAKFKGVSVSEAYQQLKPKLDADAEYRKTQSATNTSRSTRSVSKVSGEDLLAKALRTGEVPDSKEGMDALTQARFKQRHGR